MATERKPWVYIASPYSIGDVCENVRASMVRFDQMMSDGVVLPFSPLLSHFQQIFGPRTWEEWLAYDLAILPRFDAVLRLPGTSEGADREVAEANRLQIPVFYDHRALYEWAARREKEVRRG